MKDSLPRNDDNRAPSVSPSTGRGRARARFLGWALIFFGIVILLNSLAAVAGRPVSPVPLVALGILATLTMFGAKHVVKRDRQVGAIVLGILTGGLMLAVGLNSRAGMVVAWLLFWVFAVMFGFRLLTRSLWDAPAADADDYFAVFGGVERRIRTADYRGGSAKVYMGNLEIDLTEADMAGNEAVVHVYATLGSIEIRIPETWALEIGVTSSHGGVEDKTRRGSATPTKRLVVDGSVMMARMKIKN